MNSSLLHKLLALLLCSGLLWSDSTIAGRGGGGRHNRDIDCVDCVSGAVSCCASGCYQLFLLCKPAPKKSHAPRPAAPKVKVRRPLLKQLAEADDTQGTGIGAL